MQRLIKTVGIRADLAGEPDKGDAAAKLVVGASPFEAFKAALDPLLAAR